MSHCCEIVNSHSPPKTNIQLKLPALSLDVYQWGGHLKTRFALWRDQKLDRAAFQHLKALDAETLNDIGLRKEDVLWADALPLSCNAALELEKIAKQRRAEPGMPL